MRICGLQCGEGHTYEAPCVLAPHRAQRGVDRLFLGGPWHEREVAIPEDAYVYRVWGLGYGEVRYRRVRMAHLPTCAVRSVMVADYWTNREAEDALREYLLTHWVQRWGRSERPHRGNAAGAPEVVPDDWQEQLFRRWVQQLPDA